MMAHLHHTTVKVSKGDVKACVAFYEDVLGLRRIDSPIAGTTWFEEGVHLYWGHDDPPHRGEVPPQHFALVLGPDYTYAENMCQGRGLFLEQGSNYWGSRRCYVKDPAGNRIELMEFMP